MNNRRVELLSPAGDLEKLKIAITYGADAVYMAGRKLGLRARAKNFGKDTMDEAIEFVHNHGKKIYFTANIFARNADLVGASEYFKDIENRGADGVIIADPGLMAICQEAAPNLAIHISTQANTTNYASALLWRKLGATRVVLARELSFAEISLITEKIKESGSKLEIEAFVHGAMCMAYSGRCLLSNYMVNRDANKGTCAHACRWKYHLVEETRPNEYMPVYEDERGTYIYNSKDLCMIEHIPDIINAGIYSLKIEGRNKAAHYAAVVTKMYREAIDDYYSDPAKYEANKPYYMQEIIKSSHRGFTTGFYYSQPDDSSQIYTTNSYIRNYDFVGLVKEYDKESGIATIEQRNKFTVGDTVEVLSPLGLPHTQIIHEIEDLKGNKRETAPHPKEIIKIKVDREVNEFDILRKQNDTPYSEV